MTECLECDPFHFGNFEIIILLCGERYINIY